MTSRYTKPAPYGPGGADDYHALLAWQNDELEHEGARLDAEDDRPTDSQIRRAGGVEEWYRQRDEARKRSEK